MRVGLVSDTHGLLRPQALDWLRGADLILHAGDVGDPAILDALAALAPVTAVRGNNDGAPWAAHLAEYVRVDAGTVAIGLVHDLKTLPVDPRAAGLRVVVSGHSHRPLVETRDGVLYVNPGSAGPRRFHLPIAAGELIVDGAHVEARVVDLP